MCNILRINCIVVAIILKLCSTACKSILVLIFYGQLVARHMKTCNKDARTKTSTIISVRAWLCPHTMPPNMLMTDYGFPDSDGCNIDINMDA